MALDADKVRGYVEELLKGNKTLTEKEVKAAIGKTFKVNPKEVGAAVIRDVRKALGIDRPGALEFAKSMLKSDPMTEAKKVIEAVAERFGVRLGPPDVSRLRPKKGKAGRRGGRAKKAAAPAAAAPAKAGRKPTRKAGRKPAKTAKAAAAPAMAPAAAAAPVAAARRGRKPARPAAGAKRAGGGISMTFQGSGDPADLAAFFQALANK